MTSAALWALPSLLFSAALWAQTTPDPADGQLFEEALEVRVVEVEVWVQKNNGEPVTSLSQDDFELRVDGQERPIEFFESAQSVKTVSSDPTVAPQRRSTKREPTYLAVYLDQHFLEDGDFERAQDELVRFLRQDLDPEDHVLLATANEELQVLVPFTQSREEVVRQVRRIGGAPDGGKLSSDYRALLRDLRAEQATRTTVVRDDISGVDRLMRKQSPQGYLQEIEIFYREASGEMRFVADQLLELIYLVSGLPGSKQVLYIGGPLPTDESKLLFETWLDVFSSDQFSPTSVRSTSEIQILSNRAISRNAGFLAGAEMFREVGKTAGVSGVTFHTLGLSSLRRSRNVLASRADVEISGSGSRSIGSISDSRATLANTNGLQTLAAMTGGRYMQGRSRFDKYFDRLATDLGGRYVLGFTGRPSAEAEPRRVEVKLREGRMARRHVVRNRETFLIKTREVEIAERTLAALMIAEDGRNPLAVEAEVKVPTATPEGWVLEVAVRLPTRSLTLVPDRKTHLGQLSIFATAGRLGQDLAPVMKARLPVRFAESDLEVALQQHVEYVFQLKSPVDPGRLAVTVRDEFGPVEATVTRPVVGPSPGRVAASAAGL
ncbi:MAG: VWA domain-containing protein [Acidobacteriota bacterium]